MSTTWRAQVRQPDGSTKSPHEIHNAHMDMVRAATGMDGADELECLRSYFVEYGFPEIGCYPGAESECAVCGGFDPDHEPRCPRTPYLEWIKQQTK